MASCLEGPFVGTHCFVAFFGVGLNLWEHRVAFFVNVLSFLGHLKFQYVKFSVFGGECRIYG